ncbi:lipopolysaccharide biosynthesis protein [Enterococcus casseliflavus]
MIKKKFVTDVILNIIASLLLTSILQIIVLPVISARVYQDTFGEILTLQGISNAIGVMFGASLNNILLIKANSYDNQSLTATFSRLFRSSIIYATILSFPLLLFFGKEQGVVIALLMIVYTIGILIRSYLTVYYRINLEYKKILLHVIITSLGYLLGIVIFFINGEWISIYLIGELFSVLYLFYTIRPKFLIRQKDGIFFQIRKDFSNFFISSMLTNVLLYLDRLLINPILGASDVAVFFAASVVGKLIGIVMQPLSGVILSYISIDITEKPSKVFKYSLGISSGIGILFFFGAYFATPFLLEVLYPDLFLEALPLYVLCNLIAVLNMISTIIQPLSLKFCPTYWQARIQIIYFICFFTLSLTFLYFYGLYGFIIGNIVSQILRLIVIIFVTNYYTQEEK